VRDERLHLVDIEGNICTLPAHPNGLPAYWCGTSHYEEKCFLRPVTLRDLCEVPHGGLFAGWFTGELRVPQGAVREYVHAGWASSYERELILSVEAGCVLQQRIVPSIPSLAPEHLKGIKLPFLKRVSCFWRSGY
jgi:hypothetical protein